LLCTSAFAATSARAAYPGQNGKIYFEACDAGCSQFDVYSVNPDGSALDNLTDVVTDQPGLPDDAGQPSVSGDGSKVVFNVDSQATAEIWRINADGTNPQRLTNDNLLDHQPSISADASKIVWNQWSPNPCPPRRRRRRDAPCSVTATSG